MPGVASAREDTSTINTVHNASEKRVIRATASPVPDHIPARADVVYCVPVDEPITTTRDVIQEDEVHEEEESVDMLQEILNSGILDWNPQESWTANHDTAHRQHIDSHCEEQSTAIESSRIAEKENDTRHSKPRRARGRPSKKGISCRQSQHHNSIFIEMILDHRQHAQDLNFHS
jgi:hypothetical protein